MTAASANTFTGNVAEIFRPCHLERENLAFRHFVFPEVQQEFGLTIHDANLCSTAAPFPVREDFDAFAQYGATVAAASSTEKAKSEFIIAPVLLELWRSLRGSCLLFSGLEWEVDCGRGLNGFCDFLLTKGETQYILWPPFVAALVVKNANIRSGLGQCIAAMYAAQLANQQTKTAVASVFGIVSTGSAWKFLCLQGKVVTIDIPEYYLDILPKIMGILREIVQTT
jgi:hypothetical protein